MITMKPEKWKKMDFDDAYEVDKMLQSRGYRVLASYWHGQREVLISKVANPKGKETREFAGGSLHGFNLACTIAEKIVQEALQQKENVKAKESIDDHFGKGG